MKLFEQLLEFVSGLTFKRAIQLLSLLFIVGFCGWIYDRYTGHSKLTQLEREVILLEKLNALQKSGYAGTKEAAIGAQISEELSRLSSPSTPSLIPDLPKETYQALAIKFGLGSLPWFFTSLFGIGAVLRKEQGAVSAFVAIQVISVFFGILNAAIPSTGSSWVDYIAIPWGIFFLVAVVPIAIKTVQKIRELNGVKSAALERAIRNQLRMISAASDQFRLEHGRDPVSLSEIVGPEPDRYIKSLMSVDGEDYELLSLKSGESLVVKRQNGVEVRLDP